MFMSSDDEARKPEAVKPNGGQLMVVAEVMRVMMGVGKEEGPRRARNVTLSISTGRSAMIVASVALRREAVAK